MNNKKFRVWDNLQKKFEYFELGNITVPDRLLSQHSYTVQQFIGILDKNMKEIYEGDVVKGIYGSEGIEIMGEVQYSYDLCAYVVDWYYKISNMEFDSLEIVGNMIEDYMYDENGELVKKIDLS
jgi:uncharacterized phage protein (TIGR01671 family)